MPLPSTNSITPALIELLKYYTIGLLVSSLTTGLTYVNDIDYYLACQVMSNNPSGATRTMVYLFRINKTKVPFRISRMALLFLSRTFNHRYDSPDNHL